MATDLNNPDQHVVAAVLMQALDLYRARMDLPFTFGALHNETTAEIANDGAVRFHAHVNGEQYCFTIHRCAIKPQEGLTRRADGTHSAFSEGQDHA